MPQDGYPYLQFPFFPTPDLSEATLIEVAPQSLKGGRHSSTLCKCLALVLASHLRTQVAIDHQRLMVRLQLTGKEHLLAMSPDAVHAHAMQVIGCVKTLAAAAHENASRSDALPLSRLQGYSMVACDLLKVLEKASRDQVTVDYVFREHIEKLPVPAMGDLTDIADEEPLQMFIDEKITAIAFIQGNGCELHVASGKQVRCSHDRKTTCALLAVDCHLRGTITRSSGEKTWHFTAGTKIEPAASKGSWQKDFIS